MVSEQKGKRKKVVQLLYQLMSHETIWSEEHQTQMDQCTKVNKISLDTIE
jgi:hypothetical protein